MTFKILQINRWKTRSRGIFGLTLLIAIVCAAAIASSSLSVITLGNEIESEHIHVEEQKVHGRVEEQKVHEHVEEQKANEHVEEPKVHEHVEEQKVHEHVEEQKANEHVEEQKVHEHVEEQKVNENTIEHVHAKIVLRQVDTKNKVTTSDNIGLHVKLSSPTQSLNYFYLVVLKTFSLINAIQHTSDNEKIIALRDIPRVNWTYEQNQYYSNYSSDLVKTVSNV
jgi:Spy/CpxP family protein refolding chaperone